MVYINRKYRFIFIENTKSGSTSILVAFEKLFKIKFNRTHSAHKTVDQVKKEIDPEIWNTFLKVSTYRDPFDRFCSSLNFKQHVIKESTLEQHMLKKNCVFCLAQEEFTKEMDFLIKLDSFQEDFDIFCKKIGVDSILLDHANKSNEEKKIINYNELYKLYLENN